VLWHDEERVNGAGNEHRGRISRIQYLLLGNQCYNQKANPMFQKFEKPPISGILFFPINLLFNFLFITINLNFNAFNLMFIHKMIENQTKKIEEQKRGEKRFSL